MDRGVILDLETTGLDPETCEIIEIGLLEFGWTKGERPAIVNMWGCLQEPSAPLSPEITNITGLTDALLKGQAIDWNMVKMVLDRAAVVIAHNAPFDKGFLDRVPELGERHDHWACSLRHIDWKGHGFSTLNLNYLAADMGFVNPFAHRALFDCATTFRVISDHLPELIASSYQRWFRVWAVGSPFESKDVLKARGYRWQAEQRCWVLEIAENRVEAEQAFLNQEIYRGRGEAKLEEFSLL